MTPAQQKVSEFYKWWLEWLKERDMTGKNEAIAEQCARDAGWTYRRAPRYWTHPDHATFDGKAADLCDWYRIQVVQGGKLVIEDK